MKLWNEVLKFLSQTSRISIYFRTFVFKFIWNETTG